MRNRPPFLTVRCLYSALLAALLLSAADLRGQGIARKTAPGLDPLSVSDSAKSFMLVVDNIDSFCAAAARAHWPLAVERRYDPGNIVVVRTSPRMLNDHLLPLDAVVFADRAQASISEELPVPGHNLFTNRINAAAAEYPSWNGAGRTVSVMERLFDTADVDLRGRVASLRTASKEVTAHASIMASLIAGAGTSDQAGQGVAPGSRLASSDFAALLPDAESEYAALDVSVQNHSYGVGIENYYGADAMAYDHSVRLRPALLHVFSAGNSGAETPALGIYQGIAGFANLTGSFKMAKNVLLAGAVDSFGRVVPYSSRGPAYDGRLKPDLVAFGPDGSSGAAALVSGTAAVLQQAYAEQHGNALPAAALIRAILINSADDVEAPGPDFASGYGNLDALDAVEAMAENRFFGGSVAKNGEAFFDLAVPAGQAELKITLCWDDPPAPAGAAYALVNDLDLTLVSPDGQTAWLPWAPGIFPHPDSLAKNAARGTDSLNNTEQVTLAFPAAGVYRIRVFGRRVIGGTQPFFIAFGGKSDGHFRWTFPLRNSPPLAGLPAVVRWESAGGTSTGVLSYRIGSDTAWLTASPAVPLSAGFHRWTPPDTFAFAQLRMRIDGQNFDSDTFLLSREMRVQVGFNCPDSVLLFWDAVGAGSTYRLWGLGGRYMEPLFMTADTQVVLQKTQFPHTAFAVSPLKDGVPGRRSGAPGIADQGVACYFRNILADLNAAAAVDVSCLLGSTHDIRRVRLEKWSAGVFNEIEHWEQPAGQLSFSSVDPSPVPGINRYRAVLETSGGNTVSSDTAVVYFAGANEYLAFPNPVSGNGTLHIIAQQSEDDVRFELLDALGRRVQELPMSETLLTVPLAGLPRGVYVCAVRRAGRYVFSDKILVR